MPLSAAELVEKSQDQRKRNRLDEALVSSLAAVEVAPEDPDSWWEVALNRIALNDTTNAIFALEKTVEISPSWDGAWARLGSLRVKIGQKEEAKQAFLRSLDVYPERKEALDGLSEIYCEEDDEQQDEAEISVLERLEGLGCLTYLQLNRCGILHYRNKHFHEAIRCWKQGAVGSTGPASRFNLGLAYEHDAVSQGADAIDMWRMVLEERADYEPAKKALARLLPRMLELAKRARTQPVTFLPKEQWYEHYMNPFELLNPSADLDFDDFDPKTIQKLKKRLLNELDLEDGAVSWLPGVAIDKSRAIGLCEELMDDTSRYYHWIVFNNKSLMGFLSRGSHVHFLVQEASSELDTIRTIEEADSNFLEWLGDIFAPQFDRVLSRVIDAGNLVVLECLLDGRRWVPPALADSCFLNARRAIDSKLHLLRNANKSADDTKPSVDKVQGLLDQGNLIGIMNLLPSYFEDFQNEAVHQLRGIAISSFNAHGDIELSRQLIDLARSFRFRSADANRSIEEDIQAIDKLITAERKHETKLTFGKKNCEITKEGVLFDDRFIGTDDVSIIRWGILISGERSAPTYDFLLVVGADDGRLTTIGWKSSNAIEQQREYFEGLINACLHYIFPPFIDRIEKRLVAGESFTVGPCSVTAQGLQFESKGWIFSESHMIPWRRVRQSMESGEVTIRDSQVSKAKVTFPLRDTANAPLLRALISIKNGEGD